MSQESPNVITDSKLHVLIYGDNNHDNVDGVIKFAQEWFREHSLTDRYVIWAYKTRLDIATSFFDSFESSPLNKPNVVLAGGWIRDFKGSERVDFPLEPDIEEISLLWKARGVPLIRYRFDESAGRPQLAEESLASALLGTSEAE